MFKRRQDPENNHSVFKKNKTQKNTLDVDIDAEGLSCPAIVAETLEVAAEFSPDLENGRLGNTKQRKPGISTQKCSWTEEKRNEIRDLFQTFFRNVQRPKPSDCL